MRENFNKCLEMVLEHEGGYVNNENDRGGMTNLGVTRRVYEDWVDRPVSEQEMRDLTPEDVAPIYRKNYADRIHFDSLDWACLDWAINSGASRPAKAIQRAVGATADGVIGPKTLQLVAEKDPEFIIDYVYTVRQSFYEGLDDYKHFGRGWSRRNKETLHQAMEMAKGGK
jgi:lysozyme family protein